MPTSLAFDTYVRLIEGAAAGLVRGAEAAGMGTPVPTCPGWSVADLVAHQGMIHRWAAANLRHEEAPFGTEAEVLSAVGADALSDWFREGADHLLATLSEVPADVDAMVFLAGAARPRDFWARRQAHETTIHAVDALAAELGRPPTTGEVAPEPDVALDGVDELLTGFMPRKRRSLRSDDPFTVTVEPTDARHRWTLQVGPGPVVTERTGAEDPDATLSGTAAQLYLGLWNRGDEVTATGRPGVLNAWRAGQQVRWGSR